MIEVTKYAPLVGQPLEVVEQAVKSDGKYVRVIQEDGVHRALTEDYNVNRLNVVVNHGIVTSIQGLG